MSHSTRLRARCPHCRRWVIGGAVHLSKQVICPGCQREFRFAVQRAAAPVAAAATGIAPGHIDLRNQEIPPHVLQLIPLAMARSKTILPLEIDQDTVVVVAPDAMAFDLQQQLEFMLGRQVRLVEAPAAEIAFAVERFYEVSEPAQENGGISHTSPSSGDTDAVPQPPEDDVRAAVIGTIQAAFESAQRQHATRIIFSHHPDSPLQIHFQLRDGKRVEAPTAPQHLADRILNYLRANIGRDGDAILEIGGSRKVLKADRQHDSDSDQIVLYIAR